MSTGQRRVCRTFASLYAAGVHPPPHPPVEGKGIQQNPPDKMYAEQY
jgi:hypothetical protein